VVTDLRGETWIEITQIMRKKGEVRGFENSCPAWNLEPRRLLGRASIAGGLKRR